MRLAIFSIVESTVYWLGGVDVVVVAVVDLVLLFLCRPFPFIFVSEAPVVVVDVPAPLASEAESVVVESFFTIVFLPFFSTVVVV